MEADPRYVLLPDPWERSAAIPLDGSLERNGFGPTLTAVVGLVLAFILFQVIVAPVAVAALLMLGGTPPEELIQELLGNIEAHTRALLTANTFGQVLGLAVPAYLFARLHTSRPAAFLRLRGADGAVLGLAVAGLLLLTPAVMWLGQVNESLPMPEWLRAFEESQLELIERVLSADTGLLFNLAVLAVTPAICEELLFRGYVQRQFERGFGITGGILLSGVVFGLYHLRLSQVVPLSVLGLYLAYLAWRTGSLWPAILVHFANNAIAVFIGAYLSAHPELGVTDFENMEVPWYIVVTGLVLFGFVLYLMHHLAERHLTERRLARSAARDERVGDLTGGGAADSVRW